MTQNDTKKLDFTAIESKWPAIWRENGVYHWNSDVPRDQTYVIDTPPPTVSGYLHIGHVYSFTQTDFIARFQRMNGKNVFYPIGYDDNGLPTERLVEKNRDIKASNMTREEFISICHDEIKLSEDVFRDLFTRLALSVDWRTEYQTISDHSRKTSQMSFLDLQKKGHLYLAEHPTLWDPVDRTAIAQAEVEEKEQQGVMYHIPFTMESGETITIATTRPELLIACVAVMCHPDDAKMKPFVGKKIYTALFNAEVTVIADERVNPEKGTGVVMCCTFGDLTDVEWWKQYKMPLRNIVGKDGLIQNTADIGSTDWPCQNPDAAKAIATQLQGQHIRKAKKFVVELLTERNLILKEEAITQSIPCAERSGSPLEIIVTPQWMVRVLDKKELLLQKTREIKWHPEYMRQRLEDWITNLKWDWCISRQRYFGVPIPVWYSKRAGEEGKPIFASIDELPVNPLVTPPKGYTMDEVTPEKDVMDTWATSSVSPQINSHGISGDFAIDAKRHAQLFPADLRPQAHEIIRTWAFYTVVKAALHEDSVPFKNTAISGWCLAHDKTKMSKSKNNVIRPEDVMQTYNVDAIRYWSSKGRLGQDSAYSDDMLKNGKRMLTKMWNASRLVQMSLGNYTPVETHAAQAVATGTIHGAFDLWLLSKLHQTVTQATDYFVEYNYTDAIGVVEKFFWSDFCDNYLELIKGRIYGEVGTEKDKQSAQATLYFAQKVILQLLAPFFPYVCEELFEELYPNDLKANKSIHARGTWPKASDVVLDSAHLTRGDLAIDILSAVRKMKSAVNQSMRVPIVHLALSPSPEAQSNWQDVEAFWPDLQKTISCEKLSWQEQPLANDNAFDGDAVRYRIQAELGQKS
jgi:valyl-tRNA synthetase